MRGGASLARRLHAPLASPTARTHAEPWPWLQVEVPVEHGLLMENLLDLAHAPFTHTGTFAKGWPVPDAVRFHAQRLLSGNWDPYPIDMSFEPPCMVVSMIGLKQAGQIEAGARATECQNHLHQLHVCLPSRRGHTRLLYRMSLDFMPWIRWVPGISVFWNYIAGQVQPSAVCRVCFATRSNGTLSQPSPRQCFQDVVRVFWIEY